MTYTEGALIPSHAKTLLAGETVGPLKMTSKQKRPFESALMYKKSGEAGGTEAHDVETGRRS